MIIEGFSSKEWIDISDIISEYCPDNELLNKLIKQEDSNNLFIFTTSNKKKWYTGKKTYN